MTVKASKELKSKYRPSLVFLMETRNNDELMERLRKKMRYDNWSYVNPKVLSGGLALWWNNEVKMKVMEATKNCINTLVTMEGKRNMSRVCWIYGSTYFDERRDWWEYIKQFVDIFKIPWMYIADFNEIKENGEKDGEN